MDDFLLSIDLGNGRSLNVASLARETVIQSGAEHLGFDGYFLFEAIEGTVEKGISVLGKASCFETALHLADLMAGRVLAAPPLQLAAAE